MPGMKTHFCLIDGTACTATDSVTLDTAPSNIALLHEETNGVNNCTSTYFAGVGTYGGRVMKTINQIFAPVAGDIDAILTDAIADLQKAHKAKKQIVVGGYSRGAALARRLACIANVPIDILFALDTVASIGLPSAKNNVPASDVAFVDANLSQHVKKAYHAVALDETRAAFNPILFNEDERVREHWFAGVHSDIGGGMFNNGLSKIVLRWLKVWLQHTGRIDLPDTQYGMNDCMQPIKMYEGMQPENRRLCCTWQKNKPTKKQGLLDSSVSQRSHKMFYLPAAKTPARTFAESHYTFRF